MTVFFPLVAAALFQGLPGYEARSAPAEATAALPADAAAWDRAHVAEWGPAPYGTAFRALWNDAGLHLRFDSDDDGPWHTMTGRDDPIWEEEVVEIFLDPERDGRYVEVEVNPAGVVCDLRRLGAGETGSDPIPVPSGTMDRGFDVAGLEVTVEAHATGWTTTAFLPWSGLGLDAAPQPGAVMPFNLFRIKRPGGPEAPAEGVVFNAWSPTGSPSFHVPEAFRPLTLVE